MNIRCYLIDDFPVILKTVSRYIESTSGLNLIGHTTNPLKAIEEIESGKVQADVVFLDIEMPGLNGLEVAEMLKEKVYIIFLTGQPHYGSEAFNLDAVDYLVKPLKYERFKSSINRLFARMNRPLLIEKNTIEPGLHSVIIPGNGKGAWTRVKYMDIIYLKSESNYNAFILKDRKLMVYGALEKISDGLPKDSFIRVHRSYVINMHHMVNGDAGEIEMSNGVNVPIGRMYREAVQKMLSGKR